jgi:SAM-dependent methyltransferase
METLIVMDFTHFDKRNYPVVSARSGYGEWAEHYDSTVAEGLDRPLLGALGAVQWPSVRSAVDLACGTGRTGVWLQQQGVRAIDGVDLTPEMLERARAREIYRTLKVADIAATGLPSSGYDLCTMVLADEHLADLKPVYREAARLLGPGGSFVVVGYHPYFLMNGIPTHYHRASGEAVTIESHIHLFSAHVAAAYEAGLSLNECREGVIDEAWLRDKPKWRRFLHWPVSFAFAWRRP